ncbi:hypothetical protein [Taklimakanibacter albus]|uniref:Uncharacterized protein n=1 Tax=Taklimakanibacter albus TaxID=2800327 RepID=A0ACC5R3S2_9HYPH|nr:hypothetical protein [Aestuariivirga sp. YIM B02566]MBK1867304.1 hypothetical protein [Aestuariivirga sp. YIM B02566]
MLADGDLKRWLHRELPQTDKLLLILAVIDSACQINDMRKRAFEAGFALPKHWNPSKTLGRAKGLAIRTPKGWEITDAGKEHLRNLGVSSLSVAAVHVAVNLRSHLSKIKNPNTRAFVEEAIKCYELELHRSAIVMSWIAAVDILYNTVLAKFAPAFNKEARRVDARWKDAMSIDDFGRMKEADFLDRLAAISAIGKNVKAELKNCLDRRNGCGHPNSLKIGPNTVAHHLEILILNVFEPFQ